MNKSQYSTGGRKTLRRKLNVESFEWTDEAISRFDSTGAAEESKGSPQEKGDGDGERSSSSLPTEPEDMDRTIARVQQRKKRKLLGRLAETRGRWKLRDPKLF